MKKCLLTIFVLAIVLSVFLLPSANQAFAQEEQEEEQGFELQDGYLVEVVYGNFYLKYGSILRSFTITFDKSFYNAMIERDRQDLMDFLEGFCIAIGFEPEVEEQGKVKGVVEYDSITDILIEQERDGYEPNEPSTSQKESTFFFTETTSKQKTIFQDMNKQNSAMNILKESFNIFGIEDDEISLNFHYGTPYKIVETDAERSYFDTNAEIYVHEFYMTVGNSDREIVMIQTTPNTANWYILAIIIGVPVIIAAFGGYIAHKIREKRRA